MRILSPKQLDQETYDRLTTSEPGFVSTDILDQIAKSTDMLTMFGGIELSDKAASAGKNDMKLSGFLSTPRIDLANEVIDVDAFDKYFNYFVRNPIYCYNHDKSVPIGRDNSPEVVKQGAKTGMYLGDVKLSALPFVTEIVWPLLTDKVITQQSIGFYSLKGKFDGDIYHHTEIYTLEGSCVPIACNPDATLDEIRNWLRIKGFDEGGTVMDLIAAYSAGKAYKVPQFVSGLLLSTKEEEKAMPANTKKHQEPGSKPDFMDVVALESKAASQLDTEGDAIRRPVKFEKNYATVCESIFAAKSDSRGVYLFPIAVPTAKGFKYDWEQAASSMYKALGGGGGALMSAEAKSAILERIEEAYAALGKQSPTVTHIVEGEPITVKVASMAHEYLETIELKDIEFHESEVEVHGLGVFKNDADRMKRMIQHWLKDKQIPEGAREVLKDLYGTVDIYMWSSLRDPMALSFINEIVSQISQFVSQPDPDGGVDDSWLMWEAPEGQQKEVNYRKMADRFGKLADEQEARIAAKQVAGKSMTTGIKAMTDEEAERLAAEFSKTLNGL